MYFEIESTYQEIDIMQEATFNPEDRTFTIELDEPLDEDFEAFEFYGNEGDRELTFSVDNDRAQALLIASASAYNGNWTESQKMADAINPTGSEVDELATICIQEVKGEDTDYLLGMAYAAHCLTWLARTNFRCN